MRLLHERDELAFVFDLGRQGQPRRSRISEYLELISKLLQRA